MATSIEWWESLTEDQRKHYKEKYFIGEKDVIDHFDLYVIYMQERVAEISAITAERDGWLGQYTKVKEENEQLKMVLRAILSDIETGMIDSKHGIAKGSWTHNELKRLFQQ